jgi:hypothetical protein
MLDFVPNHTALDHAWSKSNPDFYVLAPNSGACASPNCVNINGNYIFTGGDMYNSGWTDTIQLNYWNPALRSAQIGVLKEIAKYADFIRCDMAHDILNDLIAKAWADKLSDSRLSKKYYRPSSEFWGDAIVSVQGSFPDVKFVAEAYNYGVTNPPELSLLRQLGFSFVYEKTILDNLIAYSQGKGSISNLNSYISGSSSDYFSKAVFFVENHDDNRAAGAVLGSLPSAEVGAILTATLPGMRLFFHGEFQGLTHKMDCHLRRSLDTGVPLSPDSVKAQSLFSSLLKVVADPIFQTGAWEYLPTSSTAPSLIAYKYTSPAYRVLVAINISSASGAGSIVLSDAMGPTGDRTKDYTITEMLTGVNYVRNPQDMQTKGLYVIVDPQSAQIFKY